MEAFTNKIISIEELWQFFNFSSSLYAIADTGGNIQHVNPSFTTLLGFSEAEFLSTPYLHYIHPKDRKGAAQKVEELKQQSNVSFCCRCLTKEGGYRWLSWVLTYSYRHQLIYANAQDHSDRIHLEAELQQERLKKQKDILSATLRGQEAEKVAIGRELHDNINQLLTCVCVYLDLAIDGGKGPTGLLTKARQIQQTALEEIRSLSKAMVAPGIKGPGLAESIEELIDTTLRKNGLAVDFTHDDFTEAIPVNLKLTLYRILQEQITNILKHARARSVTISLEATRDESILVIQDDGAGFTLHRSGKGIGLQNIRSRAELYGGRVHIQTAPGKGCRLTVAIPRNF